MQIEVEHKYRVTEPGDLARRLRQLDAGFGDAQTQVDTYYAHPARDFARTDEALRIRRVGESNYITYKGPKLDAHTKTRREIELPLAAGEAAAGEFEQLLVALGFQPVAAVEKRRQHVAVAWQNRQVEVALDDVIGLGRFVELELLVNDADVAAAQACLASLAQILELSKSERRSYLELLIETQRQAPANP